MDRQAQLLDVAGRLLARFNHRGHLKGLCSARERVCILTAFREFPPTSILNNLPNCAVVRDGGEPAIHALEQKMSSALTQWGKDRGVIKQDEIVYVAIAVIRLIDPVPEGQA